MAWFEKDEDFWKGFQRLNALCGDSMRWETPTARKEHTDIFGQTVKPNETYFSRDYSGTFGARLIVSRQSMDALLMALLIPHGYAEGMADLLIEEQAERFREVSKRAFGRGASPDQGSAEG